MSVNGLDRQPNAGTDLLGGNYSVRSRSALTEDGDGAPRWVAIDESGQHGDQQYRTSRYMALGVVAIDDVTASRVIDELRGRAERDRVRIQAEELHFSASFAGPGAGKERRRALLAEALGPGGSLDGRVSAYLVDAYYFVVAKLVSLLIEETVYASGAPPLGPAIELTLARNLALEGPKALGEDGFANLVATSGMFFSKRNRNGDLVSVDQLFTIFRDSRNRARRRKAPQARKAFEVLDLLLSTRSEAEEFVRNQAAVPGSPEADVVRDSMEPLIPSVVAAIANAAERHGNIGALGDEQRLLTDDTLELMERGVNAQGRLQGLYEARWLEQLVRGVSREHPSLQLADLVAGSALAVARLRNGEDSQAGQQLQAAINPLVDPNSLLPYADVQGFLLAGQ